MMNRTVDNGVKDFKYRDLKKEVVDGQKLPFDLMTGGSPHRDYSPPKMKQQSIHVQRTQKLDRKSNIMLRDLSPYNTRNLKSALDNPKVVSHQDRDLDNNVKRIMRK